MEFKEYVEIRMKEVGINSFRQLAFKMDVSPGNLTNIFKNPTFQTIKKIASALDCDLCDLFKPQAGNLHAGWQPKEVDKRQIDQIYIKYSDGSADRFTRDPDVID